MSQVDPWEKAAECARAIQISLDPKKPFSPICSRCGLCLPTNAAS